MSRGVGLDRAWDWLTGRAERAQVEVELREEFAGHVDRIEQDLISQGMSSEEARLGSAERFGDVERLVRDATKIKLGGSLMLQKINLVLLVVIGAAVVWLLVQNQRISARSVQTLEQVSASLVELQSRPSATAAAASGPHQKQVYAEGLIEKPGAYLIPPGGLTLRRLVATAGGFKEGATTIYVGHEAEGAQDSVYATSGFDSQDDPVLKDGDVITVSDKADSRAPRLIQVNLNGYIRNPHKAWVAEQGATLAGVLTSNSSLEPEAAYVRIDRVTPAPWSTTLTIAEAMAEVGKGIKLQSGDVVTVTNPEADAAAPKDWKRYERPSLVRDLVRSDRELSRRVELREGYDRTYDAYAKASYPPGHPDIQNLRDNATIADGWIAARVCELLVAEMDRAAANDESLRELRASRTQLEADAEMGMATAKQRIDKRIKAALATQAVVARYEELTNGQGR